MPNPSNSNMAASDKSSHRFVGVAHDPGKMAVRGGALTNHLPALAAEVHCRRPSTTASPTPMALDPEAALGGDARAGIFGDDGEGAPAPG